MIQESEPHVIKIIIIKKKGYVAIESKSTFMFSLKWSHLLT